MNSHESRKPIRKTTVALAISFVLLSAFLITVCLCHSRILEYYTAHVKYKVYGGMTSELKDSELFEDMQSGRSFCFLGDSITCGTETNGDQWFRPLMPYIKGEVSMTAHGGMMVSHLLRFKESIPAADVYVIAIGFNDIVFRDNENAAHSADEFTGSCNLLAEEIRNISPEAKIYFISPWLFIDQDESTICTGIQYRDALRIWCSDAGYIYIDPNPYIIAVFDKDGVSEYMLDNFHPNSPKGIGLYSYAVLKAARNGQCT